MKTYKRSFWRAFSTIYRLPCITILFITLITLTCIDGIFHYMQLSIIAIPSIILLIIPTQYFYITIYEDRIFLKNYIYRFWKKDLYFNEIERCIVGNRGGFTLDYIQFYINGKKSWMYVIDMVGKKNYQPLIDDLRKRGVTVEVKNIRDIY